MSPWLLLSLALLAAPPIELHALDGELLSGELASLDAQQLVIRTEGHQRSIPLPAVLHLDFHRPNSPAPHGSGLLIALTDQSMLPAASFSVTGDRAMIELPAASATLPLAVVSQVRKSEASDVDQRQWEQILSENLAGDVIVLRKNDALDYLEGVLHDVDAAQARFEIDGETVPVKWSKIFGLIYHRSRGDHSPPPLCRVDDVYGSRFFAAAVSLQDDALNLTLASGATVKLPLEAVSRLDYSLGKLVYLSDLDWDRRASTRAAAFGPSVPPDPETDLFAPQRDRALEGGPLLLRKKPYAKGLALHSRTLLVYRLPDGFRRFTAIAGIDDRMERRGNVRLVIEADDRRLLEATLSGGEDPLPIDLDVAGARKLAILVDFGADQDVSDHLNLADAKLIK
jgi:hypothetical protein